VKEFDKTFKICLCLGKEWQKYERKKQ
jgi:hypothetical protein